MDYGPSRRAKDGADRYHLWDYESDKGAHTLSLLPSVVRSIAAGNQPFDPAEFVTWQTKWFVSRDWDKFS